MTAFDGVLAALEAAGSRVTTRGTGEASAQCPAHEDATASLSVSHREDVGALLHCHAGCPVDAVLGALNLARGDLFDRPRERRQGFAVVAEYSYRAEDGSVLFVKERRFPKEFRQYRPADGGRREYRLGDVRRVLYRLPEVLAAVEAGRPVYVVEGEKDADALTTAGATATTWPEGAWQPGSRPKWRAEYTTTLAGAQVVIVADDDAPGRHTASTIAAALAGVAASVTTLLPAAGKDAADHLAAGHGIDAFRPLTSEVAEPTTTAHVPPVEDVEATVTWLDAMDGLQRRREMYGLIGRLAAGSAGLQDAYRTQVCDRSWMKLTDWREALATERRTARAAEAEMRQQRRSVKLTGADDHPYREKSGCLYRETEDGTFLVSRFVAKVIADVKRDDGTESMVMLRVTCTTPTGRVETVDVSAEQVYNVRRWATQALGSDAVIPPSPQAADHVWTAAQLLGEQDGIERRVEYTHTGWRVLGGRHLFLSSAGALGSDGMDVTVRVDLGGDVLAEYHLVDTVMVDPGDVRAAVRASMDLVLTAVPKVTVPQLAAAYRAVLPVAPDTSVFVAGTSGSLKTAFSAVVLQHFGAGFSGKRLPAEWKATGNALEGQAHALANVLLIIDDYAPQASDDPRKLAASADRVLRGSANSSGRARMRPDGTLRPVKPPRAQILTTGEDVPPGQSLRARLTIVEVDGTTYDRDRLTHAQRLGSEGVYLTAMSAFIRWLARQRDDADQQFDAQLRRRLEGLRNGLQADGQHLRTPEASASLYLGWETFLRFAVDVEAVTGEEASARARMVREALAEQAAAQAGYITAADPVQLWVTALRAALTAGAAHLADSRTGGQPVRPSSCGWRTSSVAGERFSETVSPGGRLIGWLTPDGEVYLDPGASYAVAREHADRAGTPLSTSERMLTRRIREAGLLVASDERHAAVKRQVGDRRARVLWVNPGVVIDPVEGDA